MLLLARALLVTLTVGILSAPLAVEAQQAEKVRRIGYLSGASPSTGPQNLTAFRQGLRDLG